MSASMQIARNARSVPPVTFDHIALPRRFPLDLNGDLRQNNNIMHVKLYYKEGCWLCDGALEMLNGLQERYGIELERIDIDSDEALYETYRFDIPVIEFEDGSTLHSRIRKKELLKKLEENQQQRATQQGP